MWYWILNVQVLNSQSMASGVWPCVCVCLSVSSWSCTEMTNRLSLFEVGLSSTHPTLCHNEIRVSPKYKYFPLELCPKFWLRKFRHGKWITLSTKLVDGRPNLLINDTTMDATWLNAQFITRRHRRRSRGGRGAQAPANDGVGGTMHSAPPNSDTSGP